MPALPRIEHTGERQQIVLVGAAPVVHDQQAGRIGNPCRTLAELKPSRHHSHPTLAPAMPSFRRLPLLKLLAIGEVLLIARDHVQRLEPKERRRLFELLKKTRGRPSELTRKERDELAALIDKAQPRLFVTTAADKLSPFPIPGARSSKRRKR